jgi:hypothetical protein
MDKKLKKKRQLKIESWNKNDERRAVIFVNCREFG